MQLDRLILDSGYEACLTYFTADPDKVEVTSDNDLIIGRNRKLTIQANPDSLLHYRNIVVMGALELKPSTLLSNPSLKGKLSFNNFYNCGDFNCTSMEIENKIYYSLKNYNIFRKKLGDIAIDFFRRESAASRHMGLTSILVPNLTR